MAAILDDLARAGSPVVVLVGNNMDAGKMETYIQAHTAAPKTVLFGFQGTGGRRETDKAVCVRFGDMGMTVGGAHGEPSTADKQALTSAFADTGYHLTWAADMDAWYKCHLAFILPIVYLCIFLSGEEGIWCQNQFPRGKCGLWRRRFFLRSQDMSYALSAS